MNRNMFAILNEVTQHQKKPLEYFGENLDVSNIDQNAEFVDFPFCSCHKEIQVAEQLY